MLTLSYKLTKVTELCKYLHIFTHAQELETTTAAKRVKMFVLRESPRTRGQVNYAHIPIINTIYTRNEMKHVYERMAGDVRETHGPCT